MAEEGNTPHSGRERGEERESNQNLSLGRLCDLLHVTDPLSSVNERNEGSLFRHLHVTSTVRSAWRAWGLRVVSTDSHYPLSKQ